MDSTTVLAIETSCDETAVALVRMEDDAEKHIRFTVLASALASQASLHAAYGGVYPSLAKREHARMLPLLLKRILPPTTKACPTPPPPPWAEEVTHHEGDTFLTETLRAAVHVAPPHLDALVVTRGPGLEPALWVGVNFARTLAHLWRLPLLGAHHLEGHLISACVEMRNTRNSAEFLFRPPPLPLLALIASGGHTELVLVPTWGERVVLGRTRDDAAGEAFDKAARMVGLPYPGGPQLSKLAAQAREHQEQLPERLPRPMRSHSSFDFSFAGLKTALRTLLTRHGVNPDDPHSLPPPLLRSIAREVEEAIVDTLVAKVAAALEESGAASLAVGGGVAANALLRASLAALAKRQGIPLKIVPPSLATDNAIMIAMGALYDWRKNASLVPIEPHLLTAHSALPWPTHTSPLGLTSVSPTHMN